MLTVQQLYYSYYSNFIHLQADSDDCTFDTADVFIWPTTDIEKAQTLEVIW